MRVVFDPIYHYLHFYQILSKLSVTKATQSKGSIRLMGSSVSDSDSLYRSGFDQF